MPFPIDGPLEPSVYLQLPLKYSTSKNVNERTKQQTNEPTNELANKHDGSQYLLVELKMIYATLILYVPKDPCVFTKDPIFHSVSVSVSATDYLIFGPSLIRPDE